MRSLRESFAAAAEEMIAALVAKGEFDGCSELAEAYPLKVFPDAIGMRPENRHYLLPVRGYGIQFLRAGERAVSSRGKACDRKSFLGWKRRRYASI